MNVMKPALVSLRAKHVAIVVGLSLVGALSVHADLDGANELSITSADPGASIESVDGTGIHNNRPAPLGLLSVDGTGLNRTAEPAEGTDAQAVSEFADLSTIDDAQAIGCESADGDASDICGSGNSDSGAIEE